jgi:hypothetical protein
MWTSLDMRVFLWSVSLANNIFPPSVQTAYAFHPYMLDEDMYIEYTRPINVIYYKTRPKRDSENIIGLQKANALRFLNRCMLHVINSLLLTVHGRHRKLS